MLMSAPLHISKNIWEYQRSRVTNNLEQATFKTENLTGDSGDVTKPTGAAQVDKCKTKK